VARVRVLMRHGTAPANLLCYIVTAPETQSPTSPAERQDKESSHVGHACRCCADCPFDEYESRSYDIIMNDLQLCSGWSWFDVHEAAPLERFSSPNHRLA
jgi:hypothetical protein